MSQTDYEELRRSTFGELDALQPLNKSSLALANSLVVKTGTGILYGLSVYSNKGSTQFIQVFDARDVPDDGAIPMTVLVVGATSNLPINWLPGRTFMAGCVVVCSSTAATKTIGSADCWFDAQYI